MNGLNIQKEKSVVKNVFCCSFYLQLSPSKKVVIFQACVGPEESKMLFSVFNEMAESVAEQKKMGIWGINPVLIFKHFK